MATKAAQQFHEIVDRKEVAAKQLLMVNPS